MLFGKKESKVQDLIQEHLCSVKDCLEEFENMIFKYLEEDSDFVNSSFAVHEKEHKADEIRRRIEAQIYEGAFMPLYRGDYITLVELVDKVANRAETISDFLAQQNPYVPPELKDRFRKLTAKVLECFEPLEKVVQALNNDWDEASRLAREVEELEQQVDRIEWGIIKDLFEDEECDLAQKLQLRDLIQLTASVSDRMEDVSDRIDIMLVKRQL
ncbi:MAG: TIGR00153 family protein [bacterium]